MELWLAAAYFMILVLFYVRYNSKLISWSLGLFLASPVFNPTWQPSADPREASLSPRVTFRNTVAQ